MFKAIRLRLTAWYVAVLGLILMTTSAGLYISIRGDILKGTDNEVRQAAEFGAASYVPYLLGEIREHGALHEDEPLAATLLWTHVELISGQFVNSQGVPPDITFFPDKASIDHVKRTGEPLFTTLTTAIGTRRETIRIYTLPVYSGRRMIAVVQSAKPITPELQLLRHVAAMLATATALGLMLAGGGGLFLADRALIPIRQAFRRQREFVADASHELRTPLAIVRASAELLDKELAGSPTQTRELVDNLISETDRMNRLVGDLLTLARADSGEADIDKQPFDLVPAAEAVVRKIGLLAKEKNIAVESHLPPSVPLRADAARIEQLLFILLDNAVKYTPDGGRVRLEAAVKKDRLELKVSDTGIGIPPEEQEHIFERFYRVNKARSRAAGGTGLGLSIARWIIAAHGGSTQVASAPGKGTTFTVTIPLE